MRSEPLPIQNDDCDDVNSQQSDNNSSDEKTDAKTTAESPTTAVVVDNVRRYIRDAGILPPAACVDAAAGDAAAAVQRERQIARCAVQAVHEAQGAEIQSLRAEIARLQVAAAASRAEAAAATRAAKAAAVAVAAAEAAAAARDQLSTSRFRPAVAVATNRRGRHAGGNGELLQALRDYTARQPSHFRFWRHNLSGKFYMFDMRLLPDAAAAADFHIDGAVVADDAEVPACPMAWETERLALEIAQLPDCAELAERIMEHRLTGMTMMLMGEADMVECVPMTVGQAQKVWAWVRKMRKHMDEHFIFPE